jgi:hypothetical protein
MMKKLYSAVLAGTAIAAVGLGATGANAATATGDAYATIVQQVTISQTTALDFGVIAPGTTAGTAVVAASSGATPTCSGGPSCLQGGNPGVFLVQGYGGETVQISVPTAPVTLTDGGSASMTAASFASSAAGPGNTVTLSGSGGTGSATVYVGATLSVGANQAAGSYSGQFTVTANYN